MDTPVTGTPRALLRLEGLAMLVAAIVGYRALGGPWLLFGILLLLPDVALLGYFAGPRVGAIAYNTTHTYLTAAVFGTLVYFQIGPAAWPVCLIWVAHIGMDRALGLGLKFETAFADTHLGHVGAARTPSP